MKLNKNLFLTALTLAALTAGAWAQTETASNAAPEKPYPAAAAAPAAPAPPPVTAADVQALREALAAQQLQIQQLTQQLQRQQAIQEAQQSADTKPAAAPAPAAPLQMAAVNNTDAAQPAAQQDAGGMAPNPQDMPARPPANPMEGPVSIHFKGITITPGGFAAAEFVRRSRALGSDLPTPFNNLTMPGASQSSISEFFGSARQSRLSVYASGRLSNMEFSSYVSADFLSAGVTSSATQTNSYTLRLRQAWGQAKWDNGWSVLGGQMWSLVTENKASIAPSDDMGRVNDARPATIDPQYNVGFSFARQYALRVTKAFGNKVAIAFAIENPEATLSTHENSDNFLIGEAGASNSYNTAGTYSFNPSPDLIAKIAFDPGFGHYEIFGLADRFTDRIFPCVEFTNPACPITLTAPSAVQAYNASKEGGGIGANARWTFANKHLVFGLHGFGGSGVGRYGAAQLPDVSINGDGSIHLVKGLQGLTTFEYHTKKLDLYAYAGAEYAARTASYDAIAGKVVGFGAPTFNNFGCYTETPPTVNTGFTPGALVNCTADSRAVIEGTAGFWYNFYNGEKGRFRFGTQYSYVTRQTWSGVGFAGPGLPGASPEGLDSMIFTSFRYYLP
jgi:hypothetical protein